MTSYDNPKKGLMIQALTKTYGVVSPACKKVGISRETHYRWLGEDAAYKAEVDSLKDFAIDFVEGKLFAGIKGGDAGLIKYYLSTQGKKRGYIEKTEQEIKYKFGVDSEEDYE